MGYRTLGHGICHRCNKFYKKNGRYSLVCSKCYIDPILARKNCKPSDTMHAMKFRSLIKLSGISSGQSLFDDEDE